MFFDKTNSLTDILKK